MVVLRDTEVELLKVDILHLVLVPESQEEQAALLVKEGRDNPVLLLRVVEHLEVLVVLGDLPEQVDLDPPQYLVHLQQIQEVLEMVDREVREDLVDLVDIQLEDLNLEQVVEVEEEVAVALVVAPAELD